MLNLQGKTLGRYHLVEPLGEGGMAVVYKAYDANLDRDVAIKVIRTEMGSDPTFLQRFQREARALARLDHPYILKVLDYGEQEGMPYLVMPFVSGGTLKARMGTPFSPVETARILAPIARALAYAHQQGIIHRDVKPANILITPSGAPILSDFGIAKLLETQDKTQLTATGVGMGTPDYMAPEQWLGTADARTDIYSLGVILFQMVAGRLPYKADTPAAVLLKHMNDPLPRPSDFVPSVPESVEHIIYKALAKDPADRFQDMDQFASALEKLASGADLDPDATLQAPIRSVPESARPPAAAPAARSAVPLKTVYPAQPDPTVVNSSLSSSPLLGTKRNVPWLWIGGGVLALAALVCLIGGGALALARFNIFGGSATPSPQPQVQAVAATSQPGSSAPAATSTPPQAAPQASPTAALPPTATPLPGPTETSTKLPPLTKIDGLPDDIPLLKENNGDLIKQDNDQAKMFMYTTSLPFDKTAEFFRTEMPKLGWSLTNTTSIEAQKAVMYSFQKGDRMAMINIASAQDKIMVQVMLPVVAP